MLIVRGEIARGGLKLGGGGVDGFRNGMLGCGEKSVALLSASELAEEVVDVKVFS